MLSRMNSVAWTEEAGGGDEAVRWPGAEVGGKEDALAVSHSQPSTFKSMLDDDDWYVQAMGAAVHHDDGMKNLTGFDGQAPVSDDVPTLFHQPLSCLLGSVCQYPFVAGLDFELPLLPPFPENPNSVVEPSGSTIPSLTQMGIPHFGPEDGILENPSLGSFNFNIGDCMDDGGFHNRGQILRPLEIFPPVGARPTLFQKRAALRQNSGVVGVVPSVSNSVGQFGDKEGRRSDFELVDEVSLDGSGLQYDSDDFTENKSDEIFMAEKGSGFAHQSGSSLNSGAPAGDDGGHKDKKKGLPAKNLMAERRRRKKLNDRLYMLRSVVPKISKMDRASILGDAIEYLKELLQRINDLHNELESTPNSSVTSTPSYHPLTPTPATLPCRVKEEICPSSLPSPNNQPVRVEVRVREGHAVNIHMFCARRPGLLLSTMRALDGLGLDVQQAVISCFNGFALDVFRAEQHNDGPDILPEEIKAILLQSAGIRAAI